MTQRRASQEGNVPRNRFVGRAACVAQNPHGPRARKSGAEATTRPASPLEATTIRASRPSLLGVAPPPMGWVARDAPCRSPPDRDSLAPPRLPRFLDLETTSKRVHHRRRRSGNSSVNQPLDRVL